MYSGRKKHSFGPFHFVSTAQIFRKGVPSLMGPVKRGYRHVGILGLQVATERPLPL